MKKFTLSLGLILGISMLAQAKDKKGPNPCRKIKEACEAAGFAKGAHKEAKGLWKDCLAPIMNDQAVAGVTVNPADLQACKVKRQKKKNKRHVEKK